MTADLKSLMKLEVPIVVVLGQRPLKIEEIRNWVPGSIIELGNGADDDLEVRVNNRAVGTGAAVKIGENFGIQINYIGDPRHRIAAMGPSDATQGPHTDEVGDEAEAAAAALLDG